MFTTFLLAVFSQYYLRRYRPGWFRKYNFLASGASFCIPICVTASLTLASSLVSAALDGGTQVMVFVYTFAVGGGSGKVVDMPLWGLVRRLAVLRTSRGTF